MKNLARAVVFASIVSMSVSAFGGVSGGNPHPTGSAYTDVIVSAVLAVLGY